MTDVSRYKQAKKVTLVGATINALLGCIKMVAGTIGHSHALIADGIHSFSDLLTDCLVVLASKYGSGSADEDHPYGHQRIETAATMFLSLLLILVGAGIAWDAFSQFLATQSIPPNYIVLWVAVISIISNELLYHYTWRQGKALKSELLVANAWHHRSDAASSIVVLIGVVGSLLGYHSLDPLAACVVALMICRMGWGLGWQSIKELVDTGVDAKTLENIKQVIIHTPGVCQLHQLRTRSMGGKILVDVHVLVDRLLSVSEGHFIAQQVHFALMNNIEHVNDVTVHIDPEDDEVAAPCKSLPPRASLLPKLNEKWGSLPAFPLLERTVFHYLDGKLTLELFFSPEAKEKQMQAFRKAAQDLPSIASIWLYKKAEVL